MIMGTYGHFFRPEKQRADLQSVARASPPTVTTKAIDHALTSPYPKTRCVPWGGGQCVPGLRGSRPHS